MRFLMAKVALRMAGETTISLAMETACRGGVEKQIHVERKKAGSRGFLRPFSSRPFCFSSIL